MSSDAGKTAETEEPSFDRAFAHRAGEAARLSPLVRRVLAPNPGPFTFHGTCSYIVGDGTVAIVDPGPLDEAHQGAILDAVRGESVSHIIVTHTHRDHSPSAAALAEITGATIVGCAPYEAPLNADGSEGKLDASHDRDYAPMHILRDGDVVEGKDWRLVALATPGHTANHLCLSLPEENALFSADHVMAWSTSVVAPPDGSMRDYMNSLSLLRGRAEEIYWPGHGGPVREPQRFVRGLINHRRQREAAILRRLEAGDSTIRQMVPVLYAGVPQALHGAAALSVFAHLIDLAERGVVATDGAPAIEGRYRLA